MVKTSKIKAVHNVNEYTNNHGTTLYHHLEMENGDKIDIGKKKRQQIGWELTYEIIGDLGQHEFTKAKAAKLENQANNYSGASNTSRQSNDDYKKGIEVGHAVNNAVNMIVAGCEFDIVKEAGNISLERKIYLQAKQILAVTNQLKSE